MLSYSVVTTSRAAVVTLRSRDNITRPLRHDSSHCFEIVNYLLTRRLDLKYSKRVFSPILLHPYRRRRHWAYRVCTPVSFMRHVGVSAYHPAGARGRILLAP
jgi:hypothetical protein